jgi:hypothetical protein
MKPPATRRIIPNTIAIAFSTMPAVAVPR